MVYITVALEVTRHASSYHAPLQWLSSITPMRLLLPLCVVTPLTVLEPPSFQRLFVVAPVTLFLPPCVVMPVASSVLKPPYSRRFSDASPTSVRRHASHYHDRSALVWAWLINMRMRICAWKARVGFACTCACWRASLRYSWQNGTPNKCPEVCSRQEAWSANCCICFREPCPCFSREKDCRK